MKIWQSREWLDDCPRCGENAEVFTDCMDNEVEDADEIRCPNCDLRGQVTVYNCDDVETCWNQFLEELEGK
jgi:DNA-directed RNA polymerase subunit RPC12/RpoP